MWAVIAGIGSISLAYLSARMGYKYPHDILIGCLTLFWIAMLRIAMFTPNKEQFRFDGMEARVALIILVISLLSLLLPLIEKSNYPRQYLYTFIVTAFFLGSGSFLAWIGQLLSLIHI